MNALRKKSAYAKGAAIIRWLHIYLSMISFGALLFFAVTGVTLNHPTWLGGNEQHTTDLSGTLPVAICASAGEESEQLVTPGHNSNDEHGNVVNESVDKLAVAEFLRSEHRLRGRVHEFQIDDFECMIVFKGPGYSADIFVERETGDYSLTETTTSAMAIMNDLHKGRDSGASWAWVIDISAFLMVIVSITGFALLFYLRRRRITGLLTGIAGTALMILAWLFMVP